jgi:hypothetical protein
MEHINSTPASPAGQTPIPEDLSSTQPLQKHCRRGANPPHCGTYCTMDLLRVIELQGQVV